MADKKISRPKIEDGLISAESLPVSSAGWSDLDPVKVEAYFSLLDETSDERSDLAMPIQERLTALGLLRPASADWQPTTAALLVFGRQPQKFMPQSSIKLARFRGTDVDGMIADRKEVFGPLDKLIEDTARFVNNNMHVPSRIDGLYRADMPQYPLVAVREAITNALAHRDYGNNGQKVTLRMFDDRLEVESPGGLAGPVTLENLGLKRYSRNPLLARVMYEMRLIEEMGTGIRRMRKALADIGSPPPSFTNDDSSFTATLPSRPVAASPVAENRTNGTNHLEAEPPRFEINETNRADYFGLLQNGLNERQARGLLYARERGRLTNRDYRTVNPDIADETARLDLLSMVDKGLLMRIGDKKGASYVPR